MTKCYYRMTKAHHIMTKAHHIRAKAHHIMTKAHHITEKAHHITWKTHHIMAKAHHIMTKAHYILTKAHHITWKAHHIMTKAHHIMTKAHHIMTKAHHIMKKKGPRTTSLTWETVSMNKHIYSKQWLWHIIKREKNYLFFENWVVDYYKNLSPLHTKIHCAKYGWNCPSGSEEANFKNFVEVFYYFIYSPLKKRSGPSFEKNLNPLYQKILCSKFGCN